VTSRRVLIIKGIIPLEKLPIHLLYNGIDQIPMARCFDSAVMKRFVDTNRARLEICWPASETIWGQVFKLDN
jgi:hypothetical protein